MTAVEARNETLWNSIPIDIRKHIDDATRYFICYHKHYKVEIHNSVTPNAFVCIDDTILKLKGLGYGVEYVDGRTDSKLIISW